MTLDFFKVLDFTLTVVPSGFNKVWYSSPLIMVFSLSIVFFEAFSLNPNRGIKNVLPRIGRNPLRLIFLLFSDGLDMILKKTVKQNN